MTPPLPPFLCPGSRFRVAFPLFRGSAGTFFLGLDNGVPFNLFPSITPFPFFFFPSPPPCVIAFIIGADSEAYLLYPLFSIDENSFSEPLSRDGRLKKSAFFPLPSFPPSLASQPRLSRTFEVYQLPSPSHENSERCQSRIVFPKKNYNPPFLSFPPPLAKLFFLFQFQAPSSPPFNGRRISPPPLSRQCGRSTFIFSLLPFRLKSN